MSKNRRRHGTPAAVLLVLAAVTAGAALLVGPHLRADSSAAGTSAPSTSAPGTPSATSAPASGAPSAKAAAITSSAPFTIKAEPRRVATDTPVPKPTRGQVQVTLTYAGFQQSSKTVQANGFAAGIIENGGTCTLTLTQGASLIKATSTAVADATTTSCGLLETAPGLAPGTWQAVLSYSSAAAHGSSVALEVTVR